MKREIRRLACVLPAVLALQAVAAVDQASATDAGPIKLGPNPVEISGIDTASGSGGTVNFWFTLNETSGQKLTLYAPQIKSLAQVQSHKRNVQVSSSAVLITRADGNSLGDSWDLPPGKTVRLSARIEGLRAGEYTGVLSVGGPDVIAVDHNFNVLMKRSELPAAVIISVGVLISVGLRNYPKMVRPELTWERRTLNLLAELDTISIQLFPPALSEQIVIDSIRRAVNDLYQDLEFETPLEVQKFGELVKKIGILRPWINVRARVTAIRPQTLAEDFKKRLEAVEKALMAQDNSDEALNKAEEVVKSLPMELDSAVKKNFETQLREFDDKCEHTLEIARASIDAKVRPKLAQARAYAANGNNDKARKSFNDARRAYVAIVCEELSGHLKGAAPTGSNNIGWENLRNKVRDELASAELAADPEAAMSEFYRAYVEYLNGFGDALHKEVESQKETDPHSREVLEQIRAGLNSVKESIQNKLWREAIKGYSDIVKAYTALFPKTADPDDWNLVRGNPLAEPVSLLPIPETAAIRLRAQVITAKSRLGRDCYDELCRLIVCAPLAVVIGVGLLWTGNPVWGSWRDIIIAFLWGLGFYQVARATLDLIKIIAKAFSK